MSEETTTDTETMTSGDELTQQLNNTEEAAEVSSKNDYDFDDTTDDDYGDSPSKDGGAEPKEEGNFFDDSLVEKAFEYGLSVEEIESIGNNDSLKTQLSILDKQFLKVGRESMNAGNVVNEKPDKQPENIPVNPDKAETGFKINLNPDVYEQDLIDNLEQMNKFYQEKMSSFEPLMEKIAAIEQKELQRETDLLYDSFDDLVNGLEDSYKDSLGKGTRHDIDNKSEQFKNRVKILENMEALTAGFKAMNKPIPNFESLFHKALYMDYASLNKKVERQNIAAQLDKHKNRMTIPPTNINQTQLSGREKAILNLKKKFGESDDNNSF